MGPCNRWLSRRPKEQGAACTRPRSLSRRTRHHRTLFCANRSEVLLRSAKATSALPLSSNVVPGPAIAMRHCKLHASPSSTYVGTRATAALLGTQHTMAHRHGSQPALDYPPLTPFSCQFQSRGPRWVEARLRHALLPNRRVQPVKS